MLTISSATVGWDKRNRPPCSAPLTGHLDSAGGPAPGEHWPSRVRLLFLFLTKSVISYVRMIEIKVLMILLLQRTEFALEGGAYKVVDPLTVTSVAPEGTLLIQRRA